MDWPPTLELLKTDRGITDSRDDAKLTLDLDAAVSYVERVRGSDFNLSGDPLSEKPEPSADLVLGTVRLAYRFFQRRQSPDGMITMGEFGAARVASFDPDVERMLGIGRFAPARFA
jgi:hypothetical protein